MSGQESLHSIKSSELCGLYLLYINHIVTMPSVLSTLQCGVANPLIADLLNLSESDITMMAEVLKKRIREEDVEPIPEPKIPKKANRHRNRGFMVNEMEEISARDFKAMFRMGRNGFNHLLARIEPRMNHSDSDLSVARAISSSGSPISKKTKLASTLRWLAGGSYHDICIEFGLCSHSFFNEDGPLWDTIKV